MTSLTVAAPYGVEGPSARVRVHEWVQWTGADVGHWYQFLGLPSNSGSAILRHIDQLPEALVGIKNLMNVERLLLHREVTPFGRGLVEQALLSRSGYSVYDFDDALFAERSRWWQDRKAKLDRALRAADCVVAGSEVLADYAAGHCPRVSLIPSCLNPSSYARRPLGRRRESLEFVWIGSSSTVQWVEPIIPIFQRIVRESGRVFLTVIGGNLGSSDAHTSKLWHRGIAEKYLQDYDVGIMPLPDTPFTRGKCAYKLLQYGAAGLATLGSPVGANVSVLEGMDGLAAETLDDWYETIRHLLQLPQTHIDLMGSDARNYVEENFSFVRWEPEWRDAVLGS